MFADRTDAGRQLADLLERRGIDADIVLAIPRGGLPVARPVADRLGVPLDVVVAKKIGMPGNPEFAVGAAASDGSVWLNEDVVERYHVDVGYLEEEGERAAETAREKLRTYRGDRAPVEMAGKTVVIVDDGVATGATARACLRQAVSADAARVVVAVPVAPPDSLAELEAEADEALAVETPAHFGAVGAFYRNFEQVSDEEAMEYLGWNGQGD